MVVREGVRLTVHSSLAIRRGVLVTITELAAVRHVLVLIPASVIIHRPVSTVLVLLSHLIHVRSVVGVRVIGVSITVGVSSSALTRHVLRGRGLSGARQGRVRGRVTAVWCVDMTVTGGRLGSRDLRLHLSTRDTESCCSSLRNSGVLGLTIGAVVVVGKALVDGIERRILACGGDGRLDRSLVCKRFLNLRLRLGDLLAEWVIGFVGVGVASEIVEGGIGSGDLRNGRKPRSGARDRRSLSWSLRLG